MRALRLCAIPALFVFLAAGCDPAPVGRCTSRADCAAAEECVDSRCVPSRDVGVPALDTGSADAPCVCGAGESCASGACAADCGDPRATPCTGTDVCDFASGRCVAPGTPGALTGAGARCGTASGAPLCLPGTECTLAGTCQPAPPCASLRCTAGAARAGVRSARRAGRSPPARRRRSRA